MRGINPDYLNKLDEGQRKFILTGYGKFFADNFLHMKAEHGYVVGPTGSGKTNKLYNLVNWLKHTETILWISASKDNDIVPLLFMGMPVNIIVPRYADLEIRIGGERYEPHPMISYASTPSDVFYAMKKDHINILEVRNAFYDRSKLLEWMIEFFKTLAEWTRLRMMPSIRPSHCTSTKGSKVSVIIDEAQWIIAGKKVTQDPLRTKATEIIAENAMEIRTYGWRLIISTQGFDNVPPIIRENMAGVFLCAGADIEDPKYLRDLCNPRDPAVRGPRHYKRNEYRFVSREGRSSPTTGPLPVPFYPKSEEDQKIAERLRIHYARKYHDKPPEEAEAEEECFPELGRFSHLVIPPEKEAAPSVSRIDIPRVIAND